jgi:hypothetical protein
MIFVRREKLYQTKKFSTHFIKIILYQIYERLTKNKKRYITSNVETIFYLYIAVL